MTVMTKRISQNASSSRKQSQGSKGAACNNIRDIVRYTSHSGFKMADLLGSDEFQEDPAAEFLAREQDDLAELGEDFGEGKPEANVSFT